MPKWTARLTIINTTNQDLKLASKYIYNGNSIVSFPEIIPAKNEGVYEIFTPSGKPLGPEFKISLVAQGTDKQNSLGSFEFHVDIPYWSSRNTLQYHCNRDLTCQVSPSTIYDSDHNYNGEVKIGARVTNDAENKKILSEKVSS